MSEWAPRRFWKEAGIAPEGAGHGIRLDGKPVRTPAGNPLVVPGAALARAIADEWRAQGSAVDPETMPLTRAANAAIDKVSAQHGEVAAHIAAYGDADLLCYRAEAPAELVARQQAGWDPLLEWLRRRHGIALVPVTGLMHRPQDRAALDRVAALTAAMDPFRLAAFHDLVGLTGSWVLGFAAAEAERPPEELWALSRLDETFQEEQWGVDAEAARAAAHKRQSFLDAARLLALCNTPD